MKRIILLAVILTSVLILPAQGIYQMWGITHTSSADDLGTIFNTDATGNNFGVRHHFGIKDPGANPLPFDLIEYNGKLYSMTSKGGHNDKGVIFEWNPASNLYIKKIDLEDSPGSSLTLKDGKFYGLTGEGGEYNGGTIFEWDPATNVYTKKINLQSTDGYFPTGILAWSAGKFYGTTLFGGNNDAGVIFEWDPATNIYTKKIDLIAAGGRAPNGSLIAVEGKFYGMTQGGGINDEGVIFEWDPVTNLYIKKIDFTRADGRYPRGGLKLSGTKLYGVTLQGGTSDEGVIFEWDPSSNLYTKKIDLSISIGRYPGGSLKLTGGKFYGMTPLGGSNDKGVIFEWDPATNQYTKKLDFAPFNVSEPMSFTITGGKLYGTTRLGGSNNSGVIFQWDLTSSLYTKKIDFNFSSGNYPSGSLVEKDGKFYGGTIFGGNNNKGVVFEFDKVTNIYTTKFDFNGINGSDLGCTLAQYAGKLYGMTSSGGINDKGVLFEFDPATNIYIKKMDMSINSGNTFYGSFILYQGKFYGMTTSGGSASKKIGVIFEWDPLTNVYSKRIDLGIDVNNGYLPFGSLALFGNKFYGMTVSGGVNEGGVIFEWDPATNVYTEKFDFSNMNGMKPYGSLTLKNGKFYGTTSSGGSIGNSNFYQGVIFEWDPVTNVYTKKIDLQEATGGQPLGTNLLLSKDKFYGMTNSGGQYGLGVIFEWDPETNVYTKKKDFDGTNGGSPYLNNLTLAAAPVAKGLPGSCINFSPVTIDNSNSNKWVSIVDNEGNAVAEIKANGNNLGIVSASMYINNAAIREDASKRLYLDRNITLKPQVQPITPVDIRLYIKGSEFLALKNAVHSNGQTPGIDSIQDLVIFKIESDCSSAASSIINPVSTTPAIWEEDYVLSASITSFSSFYFAGKQQAGCPCPVIACNDDTIVTVKAGRCGAVVSYDPVVTMDLCGNTTVTQIKGLPSGAFFSVGTTTNTFVATSTSGKKDTCSFTVTVKDNEAPYITPAFAYPLLLWPPNHQMKTVTVFYKAWDNCGAVSSSLAVSSSEPITGTGVGDRAPDWVILDNHHLLLRAERSGRGNGRTYTITITGKDASGNTSKQTTRVFVPHHLHGVFSKGVNNPHDKEGYIDASGDYVDQPFACRIHPNPSTQYFTLEITSASNEKIEASLLDISGRLIKRLATTKNKTIRFGDDLRPGVYIMDVKQGAQQKTMKVIKQ